MNKYSLVFIIIIVLILFIYRNEKCKVNEKFTGISNKQIPKIIIQTWKDDQIPGKYYNDVESVIKKNSDYKYLFFTDKNIDDFLMNNYSNYYSSYKKLPLKIQQIDYFRYIVIYHYGGFYFDLDIFCHESFNDLLKYNCVFPVDTNLYNSDCSKDRITYYCDNKLLKINYLLGQYAFGATQNNEFIKYIIDGIHNNIDNYIKQYNDLMNDTKLNNDEKKVKKEYYVYKSTGPDYITEKYLTFNNKQNIHILKHHRNQQFGKYAVHNHYGTWK